MDRNLIHQQGIVVMEKRQAIILSALVTVLVCGVFALGVGLGVQSKPVKVCKSVDPLLLLGEIQKDKAAAAEEKKDVELSFHTALLEPDDPDREAELPPSNTPSDPASRPSEVTGAAGVPILNGVEPAILPETVSKDPGTFSLQVGSFKTIWKAKLFAENLQKKGYETSIVTAPDPEAGDGKKIYRVRVGRFERKGEAITYRQKFETKERIPSFVVKRTFKSEDNTPGNLD